MFSLFSVICFPTNKFSDFFCNFKQIRHFLQKIDRIGVQR